MQVLKWLVINKPLRPNHRTFTMAALFGNLSLLKWLASKYPIKVDNEILNSAVASNNLIMVQWLIKNKNVKPNTAIRHCGEPFIINWLENSLKELPQKTKSRRPKKKTSHRCIIHYKTM